MCSAAVNFSDSACERNSAGLVRAVGLAAVGVQAQCVVGQLVAAFLRDGVLALFDLGIEEFLDMAAVEADQVVMVL